MRIFTYIVFLFLSLGIWGQNSMNFSLVTEKNKIQIGDQLLVSLRLSYDANTAPNEIKFPLLEIGKSLNDTIDIVDVGPAETSTETDNNGNPIMTWQTNFVIGIYAGGNIEVGPFEVIYKEDTIQSNVATVQVATPELQEDKGFVGIKGIEKDPFTFWENVIIWLRAYWLWIVVPIAIVVCIILAHYFYKKREQNPAPVGPIFTLPEILNRKLNEIDQAQLWQQGKHKEYYTEVTDVIRKLLEFQYQIPTLEKTSQEILSSLKLTSISTDELQMLRNLFGLSDMIKFAKSMPLPEENEKAIIIARDLVNKELNKQIKK